jgi:hypothetical protein
VAGKGQGGIAVNVRFFLTALYGACLAWTAPAAAQQIESSYTDLDLNTMCTVIESDDFGTMWACEGLKGIPIMVSEGDLRMFVSYGLTSTTEGHWKPFATILRFFTQREEGEAEGQILVVTKVAAGATCHVGYVDALANPDANELARKVADEKAKDFDCATAEPEYVGKFEAWER